jgi:hypothetical protein
MQKEYINNCDDRSLLICAVDGSIGNSQGGMMHLMLGSRVLATTGLASMMQQEGFDRVFSMARVTSTDDYYTEDAITSKRRQLRKLYGMAGFAAFWVLFILGFQIAGIGNLITTVSNLLLMAYIGLVLYREIMPLRRQIARLKTTISEEKEARLKHRLATFFGEMMRRSQMDDNDDE